MAGSGEAPTGVGDKSNPQESANPADSNAAQGASPNDNLETPVVCGVKWCAVDKLPPGPDPRKHEFPGWGYTQWKWVKDVD